MTPTVLNQLMVDQERIWQTLILESRKQDFKPSERELLLKAEHSCRESLMYLEAFRNRLWGQTELKPSQEMKSASDSW